MTWRAMDAADNVPAMEPSNGVGISVDVVDAGRVDVAVVEGIYVAGAATGENAELLRHILRIHEATGHKGTWVLDRGFDRRELYGPLVENPGAFTGHFNK